MIAATTALEWIWRNWKLVLGGLVVGVLGLMLVFAKADARHWHKKYDTAQASFQLEVAKHAVTRQSVALLETKVGEQNAAIDRMAADSNARIREGADALAAVKQGRSATESAVAALQASAVRNIAAGAPCVSSDAVKAIGKDL